MDELICKINDCINSLDDIADELNFTYEIDSTELNRITDLLVGFNTKLRGRLD